MNLHFKTQQTAFWDEFRGKLKGVLDITISSAFNTINHASHSLPGLILELKCEVTCKFQQNVTTFQTRQLQQTPSKQIIYITGNHKKISLAEYAPVSVFVCL